MPTLPSARRLAAALAAFSIVSSLVLAAPAMADDDTSTPPEVVTEQVDTTAPDETPVDDTITDESAPDDTTGEESTPSASRTVSSATTVTPTNTGCLGSTAYVTISSASQLYYDNRTGGSSSVTSGGLAVSWQGPDLSQSKVAWYYATDFPLTELGTPSISYSLTSGDPVGQNFSVRDNGAWKGNIVQEPGIPNFWTTFSIPGMSPQPGFEYRKAVGTIDDFLAAYAADTAANGTTHDLRVVAIGGSGGSGSQGVGVVHSQSAGCYVLTYKAPAPPVGKPVILTPTSGIVTNTSVLNASWTTVPLATSYETRVATNEAMTEGLVGPFGDFGTSLSTTVAEGTYWFQVRGKNADGVSDWSTASKFTTDTTSPHVVSEKQVYETKEGGRIAVTLTFSEPITFNAPQGWNGSGTTWTKIYYSSKPYTVAFKDSANNAGTYSFTVDATKPTVTGIQQEWQAKEGGRISVTLTFSESINPESLPQGWYGSGTTFTKAFYTTKEVTVPFTDLVGNPGTYTFTVDATAPTVPTNLSPNGWTVSANAFTWAASTDTHGPVTYEVAIGNHPNLVGAAGTQMSSGFVSLGTTTATNFSYALPIGATFWQVRAIDTVGNVSKWTAPAGVQVIGVPVLSSSQAGLITGDLTVNWTGINGIGGLDGYQVEYTLADGSTVVKLVSGLADTQVASLANQGAVSVRVRGIYAIGFTAGYPETKNGEWSNTLSFTRDSVGPKTKPFNPSNSGYLAADSTTVVWTADADATKFEVRTSTSPSRDGNNMLDGTGSSAAVTLSQVTVLEQALTDLPEGYTWWQVRGYDQYGNAGPWSDIWAFGVDTIAPGTVLLSSPDNGEYKSTSAFNLEWNTLADTEKYILETTTVAQSSTPGDFTSLLGGGQSVQSGLTFAANGAPDATYYWHVRARDVAGNLGPWSETRSVTIDTEAPGAVSLLTPANPTSTTTPSATFTWSSFELVPLYAFEISSASDELADNGSFKDFGTGGPFPATSPTIDASSLPVGTYYWHVKAIDAAGNASVWSPVWKITVTAPVVPPTTPGGAVTPPATAPLTIVTPTATAAALAAVAAVTPATTPADSTTGDQPSDSTDQLPTEAFDGQTTGDAAPWWPWAVGAAILLLLAALWFIFLRRRSAGGSAA